MSDTRFTVRFTDEQMDILRQAWSIDGAAYWEPQTLGQWMRRILMQYSNDLVTDYEENTLGRRRE